MADVNRGNRPLSPFLTSYQQPFNAVLSILHRATGAGLTVGALLVVLWFLGAASGAESFTFFDDLVTSWIGGLVLLGCLVMMWYHFFNGIRHLIWDVGYGYEKPAVKKTGVIMLGATAGMSLITLIVAFI
ncbi:MAG: succinate dehydrogenase, cytochrome b556 subunit [Pseudomonadota bacterium]